MLKIPVQVIFILRFSVLLTDGFPAISNLPLHKRMDLSVLRRTFNVESYENVPEYEVVQLRTLVKRSADQKEELKEFHLSAFGKALHLHLQRNGDFEEQLKTMKVYVAESTDSGIQYREEIVEDDEPGVTYQDLANMAAVTIRHGEDRKVQMEGTIGDNLVVKPVPANIWSLDSEFFLDVEQEKSNFSAHYANSSSSEEFSSTPSNSCAHLVYKSQIASNESYTNFLPLDDVLNNSNTSSADGHRSKRSALPSHVWPEVLLLVDYDSYAVHGFSKKEVRRYYINFLNGVLLLVDYDSYAVHGFSKKEVRRYYANFLNGVDLRFKAISNPKINLILSGIVVAERREATPYLEFNRVSSPKRDLFDGDRALNDLSHYLYAVDGLPEYDLAVVLTKMDMCVRAGRECNNNVNGYAHRGGACSVFKGLERVYKIAIVEDKGGFGGIITAAHEIGHLLGAVHDGSTDTHGRPGASQCSFDDGFIMSYRRYTERAFQWSWCSIQQFRHFLNSEEASCLFNKPNHNVLAGSELPGTVLSLHGQCKREEGTFACAADHEVCTLLYCYQANGGCRASRAPAEGSHCGGGHICRNGKCVANNVIRSPNLNNRSLYNSRHNLIYTAGTLKTTVRAKVCKDNDNALDDGLTCYQLLQSYGFIACKTSSIVENCCYSRRIFCSRN